MKLNYFIGAHENVTQNGHGLFSIHFRSLFVSVGSFDCRFGGCDKYLMQHAGTFFAFNSFESLVVGQQSQFFGGGSATVTIFVNITFNIYSKEVNCKNGFDLALS